MKPWNTWESQGCKSAETFHLSGGEKQKVALAGILAMRPSILLLDEPLASLDPASAQETLALVRQMVDEGMTVLMVEHRVEDVLGMRPDRVLYMEGGRSRYLGPVEGLGKVVDYHEIKLPAREVIERAKELTPPDEVRFFPAMFPSSTGSAAPGSEPDSEVKPGSHQALVRFERVCFTYGNGQGSTGEANVLDGINLEIRRGDVMAILGPNGAGKTTLVKHAIGLLKPKSGRVLVNGKDTRQLRVARSPEPWDMFSKAPAICCLLRPCDEELAFGPTNLGTAPADVIQKEVQEAIEIVNLSVRENDPPLALSFGQQKAGQHRGHPGDALAHPGDGRADRRAGLQELYELYGRHSATAKLRSHPVHHA